MQFDLFELLTSAIQVQQTLGCGQAEDQGNRLWNSDEFQNIIARIKEEESDSELQLHEGLRAYIMYEFLELHEIAVRKKLLSRIEDFSEWIFDVDDAHPFSLLNCLRSYVGQGISYETVDQFRNEVGSRHPIWAAANKIRLDAEAA